MPDLGDQLRRWADQAEPVTAEEARHRSAADVDHGGHRPDRRATLAVAAVVVLLVGIGVAIAVRSGDDPGDDVRTVPSPTSTPGEPSTTPTTPTTTAPTTTTTDPPADPIVPQTFVAHDAEHRLVVVDTATGETQRVLDTFDDPDAAVPEGEPAGMGRYLGRFAVGADAVYFETCCEPAVGEVFRVPIEGGEPERVTYGTDPAISPDGTKLAVVELQSLKVVDLRTGEETRYPIADNSPVVALAHPSWSPDGTVLALERYDESIDQGRVVVVTFDGAEDVLNAATTVAEFDDGGTPTFPTFDATGRLLVVYQPLRDQVASGPGQLLTIDPVDGSQLAAPTPLADAVLAQSRSLNGFVIQLLADDTVVLNAALAPEEVADLGLLDVAW